MALKLNFLTGNLDIVLDKAVEIKFDTSSTTFVTATEVQSAIEELDSELASLPTPIFYAGTYDALNNVPDLDLAGARISGALYYVNVAGTHDFGAFGGVIELGIGDNVVFNGTVWQKWDNTDNIISVNGQTGVVVLDSDDIAEGTTNLYFTDERAQDAVGNILTDSTTIDFTYNDALNSITASIQANSITDTEISTLAAISRAKIATGTPNRLVYNISPSGALSDLPAITAARALESDANGLPVASVVTSTELSYVSGVTSSIQTQLNSKFGFTVVSVSTDITLSNNTVNLVDTNAVRTLTLPAPSLNAQITIKDDDGLANTNPITINRNSTENIDGQNSIIIDSNWGSVTLISDGTNWRII